MQGIRRMRPLLGTFVEIQARAPAALAEAGIEAAFAAIDAVQRQMSFFDATSELSCINLHAWKRPVPVSPSTFRVLLLARHMARASLGLFDFTVGGRLVRDGVLPDHGFPALDEEGWEALELLPRLRVRLRRPVVITLDGIAKGFAVDAAVQALLAAGVTRGVVNAGGDLRLFGPEPVPIAVREASGALRTLGRFRNTALATSAVGLALEDQARFPSCILTPQACDGTTCPHFATCPRAWTVMAGEAWRADALTKVAALAPKAGRDARLARLGGRLIVAGEDGREH